MARPNRSRSDAKKPDADKNQREQHRDQRSPPGVSRSGSGDRDGIALDIHRQTRRGSRQRVVVDLDFTLLDQFAHRFVQVRGVASDHAGVGLLECRQLQCAAVFFPYSPEPGLRGVRIKVDLAVGIGMDQVDHIERIAAVLGLHAPGASHHPLIGRKGLGPAFRAFQAALGDGECLPVEGDAAAPQEIVNAEQQYSDSDDREDQEHQQFRSGVTGPQHRKQPNGGDAPPDQRKQNQEQGANLATLLMRLDRRRGQIYPPSPATPASATQIDADSHNSSRPVSVETTSSVACGCEFSAYARSICRDDFGVARP